MVGMAKTKRGLMLLRLGGALSIQSHLHDVVVPFWMPKRSAELGTFLFRLIRFFHILGKPQRSSSLVMRTYTDVALGSFNHDGRCRIGGISLPL